MKKFLNQLALILAVLSFSANAEVQLLRIGTGGPSATYYPVGQMIARAISEFPGSDDCETSQCSGANVLAVAQTSNGSIANIAELESGALEAALVQADIAHWAFNGSGVYTGQVKAPKIRAIAQLYSESLHLVARRGANIHSVYDLVGKKISLDEPGSGTLVDVSILLDSYDLETEDMDVEYVKPVIAKDKLRSGDLDAFFIVAGYPVGSVSELADDGQIDLVPINGPGMNRLLAKERFFYKDVIPSGVYSGIADTNTLGVGALLVVSGDLSNDVVYEITKALWSQFARNIFMGGHAKGKEIELKEALLGVTIPVHEGALRFYNELGVTSQRQ